ncbi:hypothetical protein BGP77_01760 [Saccharospirillum sp. MSK14-1]|uniref:hypothetical protein n=1 Tax=Saccharospirillum sp. MSK14-1 TaxID=1897632 RepID=UPI000D38FDFC|nr:hypothetical protein [Saccharospirillum sp. MSK14-1]PTY36070.1 hypothetical protein BGP77_01760 [Saccharospirillum sp. MSK14-1]
MSMNSVCNSTLEPQVGHLHRPVWLEKLQRRLVCWQRRRRMARLLDYDDHLLEDMGHRRSDLLEALALPMDVDARALLSQRKEERRRTG